MNAFQTGPRHWVTLPMCRWAPAAGHLLLGVASPCHQEQQYAQTSIMPLTVAPSVLRLSRLGKPLQVSVIFHSQDFALTLPPI